jgi:hypothetical protein
MILLEGLDQRILKDRNEIIKSIKENESKHSFAYFAGWADGDGSFLKNETYVLKIQYEEPLFAFNQLYKTSILLSTPDRREWINESDPRKFVTLSSLRYNHFCENVLPFIVGYKRNKIINYLDKKNINTSDVSYKQHTKEEFCQWFAGFAEAEGHFSGKSNIDIGNSDKAPIEFISDSLKKFFNIEIPFKTYKMSDEVEGKYSRILQFKDNQGNILKQYTRKAKEKYKILIPGRFVKKYLYQHMIDHMTIPYKKEALIKMFERDNYKNWKNA